MKKLVAKNFSIYSLPNILSRLVPFITLPITTKYLNLTDFGYIAVFELCIIPFQIMLGFGPGYVINSMWFKLNGTNRGELIFSLLLVGTSIVSISILVLGLFSNTIFPLIAGDEWVKIRPLFVLLVISAIAIVPSTVFDSWVIIEKKALLSSTIKILQIVLGASTVILIARYTQNYRLIILGNVAVSAMIAIVQFFCLTRVLKVAFKRELFDIIYKVSSPIFLRSLFNVLRTQFDRILVSRLYGAGQFAVYNFSGKVNTMLNEVGDNYQNAYDPYIYKGLADNDLNTEHLRSLFFAWGYATILFCATLLLFGLKLLTLFTHSIFIDAFPLIQLYSCILVVSLPFMGNAQVVIFHQKTRYLLLITIIQAVVIMALALLFIPKYGARAGVISFWAGTLIYMLLYHYKKRQLCKVNFVEKMILPYVVAYHAVILLRVFKLELIANGLLIAIVAAISVHFFTINRSLIANLVFRR
jgi:O-antigen/teichoic acid export membrane protein